MSKAEWIAEYLAENTYAYLAWRTVAGRGQMFAAIVAAMVRYYDADPGGPAEMLAAPWIVGGVL